MKRSHHDISSTTVPMDASLVASTTNTTTTTDSSLSSSSSSSTSSLLSESAPSSTSDGMTSLLSKEKTSSSTVVTTPSRTKDSSSSASSAFTAHLFKSDYPLHDTKRIYTRTDILTFLQQFLPPHTNVEEDAADLINVLCLEFFSFVLQEANVLADLRYHKEQQQNHASSSSSSLSSSSSSSHSSHSSTMTKNYGIPPEDPSIEDLPDNVPTTTVRTGKGSSTTKATNLSTDTLLSTATTNPSKPIVQAIDLEHALDTLGYHSISEVLRLWYSQQYLPSSSSSSSSTQSSTVTGITNESSVSSSVRQQD